MSDQQVEVGSKAPDTAARVKALYHVMQSIENKLGGGEGVEGLYGSVTRTGMQKVLDCLRAECGLDSSSRLVDIGAGLGRPLLHALLDPGVGAAWGVEIDRIKVDKARAFLRQTLLQLQRRGVAGDGLTAPEVQCCAIEQIPTLDPCTHAYSFWEGVPVDGKAGFGALFAASRTLRSVAVVQRAIRTDPAEYMADLGFGPLMLVDCFSVSMSGSGRSFTAYVFNRVPTPGRPLPPLAAAQHAEPASVQTPAQQAEPAAATLSTGAARQGTSSLAAEAAAAHEMQGQLQQQSPARGGRGARLRRPSSKQQAADEEQQVQASTRQQRVERRTASSATAQPAGPAAPSPSKARRAGGAAAAAAAARPAAKLASPQKAGVQKRGSPQKPGDGRPAAPLPPQRSSLRQGLLQSFAAARAGLAAVAAGKGKPVPAAAKADKGAAGEGRRTRRGLLQPDAAHLVLGSQESSN